MLNRNIPRARARDIQPFNQELNEVDDEDEGPTWNLEDDTPYTLEDGRTPLSGEADNDKD